jgi:hypothetical protein
MHRDLPCLEKEFSIHETWRLWNAKHLLDRLLLWMASNTGGTYT